MEKTWWKEAVVYQVYPRSFMDSNGDGIGDLRGITSKLDYLKELGIDVIWLSPVYQSPNDDNGYDISDYQDIMKEFGTLDDFAEMLTEAHKRGIKIMMDLVVNHTSDEHIWFIKSRESKENNPYRDYYIWRPGKVNGEPPNNWGSAFGGSAWEYDEKTGEYYLHLFSKKQPDLNWENPVLRQEIYKMMRWWLDKGVDGFRMDVINFISKVERLPNGEMKPGHKYGDGSPYYMNGPKIHDYLQEMNREVLSKYDIITVGEMPGVDVEEAKLYTGESQNELQMVFHFKHVGLGDGIYGKWSPGEWKLTDLKKIFAHWQYGLADDGWNSLYWSNHDQPRAVSRFGNDKEYRVETAKMLATCLHLHQGTPYIYQGEEIGMTNVQFQNLDDYRDIETLNAYRDLVDSGNLSHEEMMAAIYQRSRDNARTPMQWSNEANGGFTTGTPWIQVNPNYKEINVEEVLNDHNSIFYYYKKLIQLRKEHEIIVYGLYDLILDDHEQIYAFTRTLDDEILLIICNFTSDTPVFELPNNITYEKHSLLISNYDVKEDEIIQSIILRPYEARVYLLKK
ncbi:glycoside hydrolase family 13 protein [Tepidibacillus fermentans]|uniref:oligo-1,6-glucosidase n=1 Tax=Tepidibacillus fermentans TaxID=1281767 RepID=A0A4R3KBH7_9BACI|nr:alpha-glucosidase [Tepidibacillus fermentans]TCS80340.1 oligo-1,6-glucosidase [Tepidibacillus fermentans]